MTHSAMPPMWVAKEWSESQDSSPTREGQQTLQNSSVLNQQQRAGEKSQIRDTNAPIFCEPLRISQRRGRSKRSISQHEFVASPRNEKRPATRRLLASFELTRT
ncbi:hypothetical protein RB854 [Rhodopirellula baltica SH 1]|uniref:Uncharacterized protein n=1 Tax=Rhodopirellula baltica (strain DSM 10527 / NCIMB 13988 / SH1) TaxID=243090 RepID=Q7UY64_RHOBA|nr:hypothetical protein RB854 [Rhodopirellula baltica SH 1]